MYKSKKKEPLISIILPVYNSSDYLFQTINSVIKQTYTNWEFLIIDDNSVDGSKNILKHFKRYKKFKIFFNKKNRGPDYCRNIGLKKCRGEYIAFLDSDDVWLYSKLEKQLKFMNKTKCSFSCTNYIPFNEKFKLPEVKPKKIYNFSNFVFDTSIATSSMMIKKKLIKNIKFVKGYRFDDYIFKCKILKKEKCFTLQYPLLKYRVRKKSISSNSFKNVIDVWRINKNILKLNFITSLKSVFLISLNSIKKYGIKTIF